MYLFSLATKTRKDAPRVLKSSTQTTTHLLLRHAHTQNTHTQNKHTYFSFPTHTQIHTHSVCHAHTTTIDHEVLCFKGSCGDVINEESCVCGVCVINVDDLTSSSGSQDIESIEEWLCVCACVCVCVNVYVYVCVFVHVCVCVSVYV